MRSTLLMTALLAATTAVSTGTAHALPVTYTFSATDFVSWSNDPVPQSTITGSFTLDGNTLTQIDLIIGSHSFTLTEAAVQSTSPGNFP